MKKHLITLLLLSFGLLGFSQLKTKKYIRNVTNNSENEIAPFLSMDGKTLIYTRKRAMDDQWKTQLSTFENGKWQRPTPFALLNLFPDQRLLGSYALNKDASKVLFVSRKYGGVGSFDIWMSSKSGSDKWSTPINLAKPVNSSDEEINPIFSHDEKSIFFVRRVAGADNGDVYQSKVRGSILWHEPKKVIFSGQYFAARIAADNKTMYLSKVISKDKIEMYISILENNSWSDPIKIDGFPENSDKYFSNSVNSTSLTISSKKEETYDLFEVKMPEQYQSTAITVLNINIDAPHKVKIVKQNDKKFNVTGNNIKDLYLLNDDTYTISMLFKDYLPIVNEVNLTNKRPAQQTLAPKPIKLVDGAISTLDFYNDDQTIHESLFRSELEALKAFAYANPTKNFEITHYQKGITIDSLKSETHFTEVIDTIITINASVTLGTDSETHRDTIQTIKTTYSNDQTKTTLEVISKLCGILPNNINLAIKKEGLDSFTKSKGVFVIVK